MMQRSSQLATPREFCPSWDVGRRIDLAVTPSASRLSTADDQRNFPDLDLDHLHPRGHFPSRAERKASMNTDRLISKQQGSNGDVLPRKPLRRHVSAGTQATCRRTQPGTGSGQEITCDGSTNTDITFGPSIDCDKCPTSSPSNSPSRSPNRGFPPLVCQDNEQFDFEIPFALHRMPFRMDFTLVSKHGTKRDQHHKLVTQCALPHTPQ